MGIQRVAATGPAKVDLVQNDLEWINAPVRAYRATDTAQQAATRSIFFDHPEDVGRNDAINKLLDLRERAHGGASIKRDELMTFTRQVKDAQTELLLDRDFFTQGVVPALRKAEQSVHIAVSEFYGEFGDYLVDLLVAKKRENPALDVRIIVDSLGGQVPFPWSSGHKRLAKLRGAGIEVRTHGFFSSSGKVEHRKLIVVDGKTAFFGGAPLADGYVGSKAFWKRFAEVKEKYGLDVARRVAFGQDERERKRYGFPNDLPGSHDFSIRHQGEGVAHLQASFLQSWLYHGGEIDRELGKAEVVKKYFPQPEPVRGVSAKYTHVVPGGKREMEHNLVDFIKAQQRTLDIELAYVYEDVIFDALVDAARRGVKVRLITNGLKVTDWPILYWVQRRQYERLHKAGVEIYELKHYSHVKLMVGDGRAVFASTGNAEWGSFTGFWDENVAVDSPTLAHEVNVRVMERDTQVDRATRITFENLPQPSLWQRFLMWLTSWLAPIVLLHNSESSERRRAVRRQRPAPRFVAVQQKDVPMNVSNVGGLQAPRRPVYAGNTKPEILSQRRTPATVSASKTQ